MAKATAPGGILLLLSALLRLQCTSSAFDIAEITLSDAIVME